MADKSTPSRISRLFPKSLWSHRFTVAWIGCFVTILLFDLLWSTITSYRGLSYVTTYLYGALLALLMAAPALCRRGRWLLAVIMLIADGLAISNLMYGRTYFYPIPPASYMLAGNVAEFGDAIVHSMRWFDILFPVITIVTLWLMGNRKQSEGKCWQAYAATTGVAALLCGMCAIFYGAPLTHIEDLKSNCYHRTTPVVAYTLPMSILSDILESNVPVTDEEKAAALAWVDRHNTENRQSVTMPLADGLVQRDSVTPRRMVVIVVESLEAWPIGKSIEGKEITPYLNRLMADTTRVLYAPQVMTQVGPGRSIDGQLLMTAGMMPMRDYVYSMRFPDHTYPHLLQSFKTKYPDAQAYLLSGDRATTWNQGAVEQSFGFDRMQFRDSWDNSESFGHPRNPSDGSLLRQIVARMEDGDIAPAGEPSFVEVITYSSHFPFVIPEEHRRISLSENYYGHMADYVTAINYTDYAIGEFITYLLNRPDGDETMIVVVGDHDGLVSERYPIRDSSPELAELVDLDLYVPMIVFNSPVTGRIGYPIGQLDVYTTVLDLASLTSSARFTGMGASAVRSGFTPYSPEATDLTPISSTIIRADLLK